MEQTTRQSEQIDALTSIIEGHIRICEWFAAENRGAAARARNEDMAREYRRVSETWQSAAEDMTRRMRTVSGL